MDVYQHQISGGLFPPASCRGKLSCSLEARTVSQAVVLPLARGAPLTVTHSDCMRRECIENSQPVVMIQHTYSPLLWVDSANLMSMVVFTL